MKSLKFMHLLVFWIGFFLWCNGFIPSIAMEPEAEMDLALRTASPLSSVAVASPTAFGAQQDTAVADLRPASLQAGGNAIGSTSPQRTYAERFIRAMDQQKRGTSTQKNLFFVEIEHSESAEEAQDDSSYRASSQHQIRSIEKTDRTDLSALERSALTETSQAFLTFLSQGDKPLFLGLPDTMISSDFPAGPFVLTSPIEISQIFEINEDQRKATLKEYLEERSCWVGRKTTTLKGKTTQQREIKISIETDFSPIQAVIRGIFYFTNPRQPYKTSVAFLTESPFFSTPQFVLASETSLEEELIPNGLPNWIYWEGDDSPYYYDVRYPVASSSRSYNKEWWRNWVEGPEMTALNWRLRAFLRNFVEDQILRHPKEQGRIPLGVIGGYKPPRGFFEVLSTSSSPRENYVYVDENGELRDVEVVELVLKSEKNTEFSSTKAYRKGTTLLTPLNLILPRDLPLGFYEIKTQNEKGLTWHHISPIPELNAASAQASNTERSVHEIKRRDPREPYAFQIHTKPDVNPSLVESLMAAQLPYVSGLVSENHSIIEQFPISFLTLHMTRWTHLRELTLKNSGFNGDVRQEFFNALSGLSNLRVLNLSGNSLSVDTFNSFLLTLLGAHLNLTDLSINLPLKPTATFRRTLYGTLAAGVIGGGVAATGPFGWMLAGAIAGGATVTGGAGGAASETAAAVAKRNSVSQWTVHTLKPLMFMQSLRNLEVFGVWRSSTGCKATQVALKKLRETLALPAIDITLYPKADGMEGYTGDKEWQLIDGDDEPS